MVRFLLSPWLSRASNAAFVITVVLFAVGYVKENNPLLYGGLALIILYVLIASVPYLGYLRPAAKPFPPQATKAVSTALAQGGTEDRRVLEEHLAGVLRANIVLVLDELNTARLEIEDAVLHEVYWDNYLRRETWDNVKEPLLRERGFQPAYELTRDAYRAIDKANQRVYSAAETYDFRIQRRHEISFLRKTLKQIEAAEGALKAFLWARDWPGL